MSNIKNFNENWDKLDFLGKGGQGETIKAISKKQNGYATIKTLHSQKDLERRGRMRREVVSLETLAHPNIPAFIDSNTEFWKDLTYKLFIAVEYINGDVLKTENLTEISNVEKVALVKKVTETVAYCHQMGIIHRDLKPDNIILRNNDINDPVIIDFGLSFNFSEDDDDFKTPDGQHLGNRFIILPEQKVGEAGKRDLRTDVTCLVGVLYYLIIGEPPTLLTDKEGNKPHQRASAKEILGQLPYYEKQSLNNIFDVGFNHAIDERWQTAKSLIEQFDIFLNAKPSNIESVNELLSLIKSSTDSVSYQDALALKNLKAEASQQILNLRQRIVVELGEGWGQSYSYYGSSHKYESKGYGLSHFISNSISGMSITMFIKMFETGNEFVIQSLVESKHNEAAELEIFRSPLKGEKDWAILESTLRPQYLQALAKEVKNNN